MSQTILISRSELCKLFNCKPPDYSEMGSQEGVPPASTLSCPGASLSIQGCFGLG